MGKTILTINVPKASAIRKPAMSPSGTICALTGIGSDLFKNQLKKTKRPLAWIIHKEIVTSKYNKSTFITDHFTYL